MKKYNRHWISFWPSAFLIFLLLIIVTDSNYSDGIATPLIIAILIIGYNFLAYKSTYLTIDSNLVEGKVGILKKEELSSKLDKITSVKVEQGILGRILNYGTVLIDTASGKFILKMINKPNEIKKELLK